MGKSTTASCFKMIACGGDSVDHDDLQTTENKSPSDRRGWSFRKRSARHRVLSNNVVTETPSSETKETPGSTAVSIHVQPELTIPEKSSAPLSKENIELSAQPQTKLSEKVDAKDDGPGEDVTLDESTIVVIQTAIRGLLAQRMLLKQKNIIKLQAVVRGHLVRSYAIGTLRCVQAIVRMQALVRARQRRLLAEGSGESSGTNSCGLTQLRAKKEKPNGPYSYISIDKLLANAFARQLMESTPRSKPINIKCEPSKSDSAWKWLERWMSVSSVTSEEPLESESDVLVKDHVEHSNDKGDVLVPSDAYTKPSNSIPVAATSAEASNEVDKLVGNDHKYLETHSFQVMSPSSSHSDLHSIDGSNSRYEIIESASTEMRETNLVEKVDANLLAKEETIDQDGPESIKLFTDQPEIEAKKLSRKPSNPSFIAAQSKFEELSSVAPSTKLMKSSIQDPGVDSTIDKVSSTNDKPSKSRDFGYADNAVSNSSTVQLIGSECGTELSISSTLDSPERSETGGNEIEIEKEIKATEEADRGRSTESLEHEANGKTVVLEPALSYAKSDKLDRYESMNSAVGDESLCSMADADSPPMEKKSEEEPSEHQPETRSKANHPVNKSSPEASPTRSHITVPESQETPSTAVSVKPKRNKREKSESNRKSNNKSSSADKKYFPNRNQDSASKSSLEQLQDHTTGKRRNSLGSGKPEHKEHGVRDSSSSSNSLPSYMQATESARAKAIANGSPRSSPDVHDKDIYVKKRHSLPSSNERQGSPRIQRSLSQAQQNAKGNVTQSPQERMWRR